MTSVPIVELVRSLHMAYTVGFGKLEREVLSNDNLPGDVRIAIVLFKNAIRCGSASLREFENRGDVLPFLHAGERYYEFYVGQATAPTSDHPTLAGSRRLVALVNAGNQILRMYFTDDHYKIGSWWELQYP